MHTSAINNCKRFIDAYIQNFDANTTIVEIGSCDSHQTIKKLFSNKYTYVGMDISEGPNVNVVLEDAYRFPQENNSVDVVVTSSCFEHVEFFWLTYLEAIRILKPNGLLYINAPSNGPFHQHPLDCWRFYGDSGKALEKWSNTNGYNVALLESFVSEKEDGDSWEDFVAVFVKDGNHVHDHPQRISDSFTSSRNHYKI